MKNHVSAETALKLKEAGFPQPTPEFLQVWYSDESPYMERIVMFNNALESRVVFLGADSIEYRYIDQLYAFAPTATDILRELGSDYFFSAIGPNLFEVDKIDPYTVGNEPCRHENPAEAAAKMWLAKKTQTMVNPAQ